MRLAFYISGHGFGHASRQVEIINTIARTLPGTHFLIRSTAASWLLQRTIRTPFTLDPRPVDTGVVQLDGLRLDAAATADAARKFYGDFDARDDAGQGGAFDTAPGVIQAIEHAYGEASAAWRLPMHGGFNTFTTIHDVPLVARHASLTPADTKRALGLPIDRPLALASFGGFGVEGIDLPSLDCLDVWDVVLTAQSRPAATPRGVHFIADADVYNRGARYEDLVRACDVVLTKPGYGIVSECIANDTAIVYTPRGEFAEYPVLVSHIERWLRHSFIEQSDLLAGRWRRALDMAASCTTPSERPPTDGAEVIADMVAAGLK